MATQIVKVKNPKILQKMETLHKIHVKRKRIQKKNLKYTKYQPLHQTPNDITLFANTGTVFHKPSSRINVLTSRMQYNYIKISTLVKESDISRFYNCPWDLPQKLQQWLHKVIALQCFREKFVKWAQLDFCSFVRKWFKLQKMTVTWLTENPH